ncbi:putative P-loop containing nucleoside triphosphate hydrolase [Helianthus annuus]|nr:putative P-loop containing nucleoside triphosphate hydrolase [Helianthus annuus]
MTPDILRNALRHRFLTLDIIKVLIFDECHNAKKNHAYAIITKLYWKNRDERVFELKYIDTSTHLLESIKAE